MKALVRGALLRPLAKWYFRPRGQTDKAYQERLLRYFIIQNTRTVFGKKYGFDTIRSSSDFQSLVPLSTYDDLQPYIESMLQGARNILWYGKVPYFSKSSGTTATSKYIPITYEALKKNHYAVSKMGLGWYLQHHKTSHLFGGEGVVMGGRLMQNPFIHNEMNVGDVSAILQHNAPWYVKHFRKPSPRVSFMENFDEKLDAMIEETKDRDITYLAGVPSRLTLFLQRLVDKQGCDSVFDIWPHLELFFWGGINIAPYRQQLLSLLPNNTITYRQNYNASEGFFAVQDKPGVDDMLLATQHHIFYEFIPFHDIHTTNPKTLLLDSLEDGKRYELVITTDGGLWRYRIGDVIEVTGLDPVRIRIVGRTKSFLNAFGEELMVHTTDAAIEYACMHYGLPRAEYVATAVVENDGGYHQWYIDFGQDVSIDHIAFARILEGYIQDHNSDYSAKRTGNILMKQLQVVFLPAGTFHKYLTSKGKLGGQHKLKRLRNDKDELIKEMGDFFV